MYHNFIGFNEEHLFLRLNGFTFPDQTEKIEVINKKLDLYYKLLSHAEKSEEFNRVLSDFMSSKMSYYYNFPKKKKILQICNSDSKLKELIETFFNIHAQKDRFDAYKDEFLCRIYSAFKELQIINNLNDIIMQQFEQIKIDNEISCGKNPQCPKINLPKDSLLIYDTSFANQLLIRIPNLLNTLVILQDRILCLIAANQGYDLNVWDEKKNKYKLLDNLPDILNKNYRKINLYLPQVKYQIKKYMNERGQTLRNYRNLDQHQLNIVMRYGIDSSGNFVVYLPDNDKEKENVYENISFELKRDGIEFLNQEFEAFHEMVEDLMKIYKAPPVEHDIGSNYPKPPTIDDYNEGECMALVQINKNEIFLHYLEGKTSNGGIPSGNKLPLKKNSIHYEII